MPQSLPIVRLYNSLTRRVEPLEPITPGRVTIYTCGSTVYRYAHIGNLRTYLFGDLLRRTLQYLGYEVLYAKNITDVGHMRETGEDPMLQAAEVEGKAPMRDRRVLHRRLAGGRAPAEHPAGRRHAQGHRPHRRDGRADPDAARARASPTRSDGNVYYDVVEFPGYGQLSGQRLEQLRAGHRVDVETDKRDPEDFALWKAAEPGRVMKWPSPWGDGFPGWHIECSAMSMKYLGERFDIHTGGIDLKFPHHEDEIAQSEGVTGHPVVSVWLHGEFLTLADAKMAKSAGNVIRVSDLPVKGFEPLAFRYLALTAHYRSKLDFTEEAMHAAASGLRRLRRAAAEQTIRTQPMSTCRRSRWLPIARASSTRSREDLGLPAALAVAHAVAAADDLDAAQRRALLLDFDRVLGLSLDAPAEAEVSELPAGAADLLEQRAAARAARDFATSDRLRDELAAHGRRGARHARRPGDDHPPLARAAGSLPIRQE